MPTDPLSLSIALVLASLSVLALLFAAASRHERRRDRFARRIHCRRRRLQGQDCLPGRCYFPACPDDCGAEKGGRA